jgi:hypothetical protein
MQKSFKSVLLTAALVVFSVTGVKPAAALDFFFSFSNTDGGIPGTVEGVISGLEDNTDFQEASSIAITSLPAPFTFPIVEGNDVTQWNIQSVNSFDVSNGTITDYLFLARTSFGPTLPGSKAFQLDNLTSFFGEDFSMNTVVEISEQTRSTAGVTFTPVPFEFESTLGLIALGGMFGGYTFLKKRKQQKSLA